jgi:arginase family enzyme
LLYASLAAATRRAIKTCKTPAILGGDHTLTFYCVRELVSRFGQLTVIHFDAHHDAYIEPRLTNYSVFHHTKRLLGVPVVGVGYRYQVDPFPAALTTNVPGPAYISLDLDYFAPELVSSVNHPIPCAKGRHCSYETFLESLDLITGHLLGFDVVEWRGSPVGSLEFLFVSRVLSLLQDKVGK